MKFQAPPDCGGVSVMGNFYDADSNGIITIDDIVISPDVLAPFGYVQISDDTPSTPVKKKAKAAPVVDAPADPAPVDPAPATEAPV